MNRGFTGERRSLVAQLPWAPPRSPRCLSLRILVFSLEATDCRDTPSAWCLHKEISELRRRQPDALGECSCPRRELKASCSPREMFLSYRPHSVDTTLRGIANCFNVNDVHLYLMGSFSGSLFGFYLVQQVKMATLITNAVTQS